MQQSNRWRKESRLNSYENQRCQQKKDPIDVYACAMRKKKKLNNKHKRKANRHTYQKATVLLLVKHSYKKWQKVMLRTMLHATFMHL